MSPVSPVPVAHPPASGARFLLGVGGLPRYEHFRLLSNSTAMKSLPGKAGGKRTKDDQDHIRGWKSKMQ